MVSLLPGSLLGQEQLVRGSSLGCPHPVRHALPPVQRSASHLVVSDSLGPHGLYSPWSSPGQNTGVGSLSLLQGIFPTQESNPGLPHCRQIPYQPSSPRGLRSSWLPLPKEQLGIPVDKNCFHLTRTTALTDGGPHLSSRWGRKRGFERPRHLPKATQSAGEGAGT